MNRYGIPHRKTTLWLGSDDEGADGMNSYGYDVHREDSMVSIEYVRKLDEDSEELQVFILPDLFPAIRRAMKAAEAARPGKKKRKTA